MITQSYTIVPTSFINDQGQHLQLTEVLQRISWLIAIIRPVANDYLKQHFTDTDLDTLYSSENLPSKGHVASAALGWSTSVKDVQNKYKTYIPDRVLRMSREHCIRILRASARRALITKTLLEAADTQAAWQKLTGEHNVYLTGYEIKNRYNAINNYILKNPSYPTSLIQMENPPVYPDILIAAATDGQWQSKVYDENTRLISWQITLPTNANPQSKKDYTKVTLRFKHPEYIKEFNKICTPTIRLTKNKSGQVQITLDVSYTKDTPKTPSKAKRSRSSSIGLDWGVSNLLTAVIAHKSKTGNAIIDSQALYFKPTGIALKLSRLKDENNFLLTKIKRIEKLITTNISSLEKKRLNVKLETLRVKRTAINNKRKTLNKTLAYAAARWVFDLVKETDAKTVYIEDLKTLTVDKQNKWFGGSVSDTVRGQVFEYLEQLGLKHGVKIISVNPKNTSKNCHKCGKELNFYTHSDLKKEGHHWAHCEGCNYTCDRDYNAAVNIVSKGILDTPKAVTVNTNKVSSGRRRKYKVVKRPKSTATPKQVKASKHNTHKLLPNKASWSCPHLRHRRLRRVRCKDITSQVGARCYGLFPHVKPAKLIKT